MQSTSLVTGGYVVPEVDFEIPPFPDECKKVRLKSTYSHTHTLTYSHTHILTHLTLAIHVHTNLTISDLMMPVMYGDEHEY